MRRRSLFPLILAACLLVPGGSAEATQRPSCSRGGTTVARSDVLRVYEVVRSTAFGAADRSLYACVRKTRRRSRVARAHEDDIYTGSDYGSVTANGRYVGLVASTYDVSCKADCPPGYNPRSSAIEVYDASRRRVVRSVATVPTGGPVVTMKGAVAWAEGSGGDVRILAEDSAGRRTLDSGAIDPKTLAVELTIVSWTKAGEERFARLR